jgi:MinD superfamily P-loop ATPase
MPSDSGHVTGSENNNTPATAAIATCDALIRFTATTGNAFNDTDNATKALKFSKPAATILNHCDESTTHNESSPLLAKVAAQRETVPTSPLMNIVAGADTPPLIV